MINDYRIKLTSQFNNAKLNSQRIYYQNLYDLISIKFKPTDRILEIGAGSGISSIFINNKNINRTDFLTWDKNSLVTGDVNAEQLPFFDNSYDAVFGVDVLHHLNSPQKAIAEVSRVLTSEGRAYFIEPYVSPFSYVIYKLFHEENTSFKYDLSHKYDDVMPQDGDQGLAKALFCTKQGLQIISANVPHEIEISIKLLHPISFFATGGLTKPIKSGKLLIKLLLKLEVFLPKTILRLFASRMYVELEIKKN